MEEVEDRDYESFEKISVFEREFWDVYCFRNFCVCSKSILFSIYLLSIGFGKKLCEIFVNLRLILVMMFIFTEGVFVLEI